MSSCAQRKENHQECLLIAIFWRKKDDWEPFPLTASLSSINTFTFGNFSHRYFLDYFIISRFAVKISTDEGKVIFCCFWVLTCRLSLRWWLKMGSAIMDDSLWNWLVSITMMYARVKCPFFSFSIPRKEGTCSWKYHFGLSSLIFRSR